MVISLYTFHELPYQKVKPLGFIGCPRRRRSPPEAFPSSESERSQQVSHWVERSGQVRHGSERSQQVRHWSETSQQVRDGVERVSWVH